LREQSTIYYGTINILLVTDSKAQVLFLSLSSSLTDADAARFHISASERADFIEEVTTELSVYLGMLYHMIEIFKGHDDFADELSEYFPRNQQQYIFLMTRRSELGSSIASLPLQCRVRSSRQECKGLSDQEGRFS
jgi:hypothetical protein